MACFSFFIKLSISISIVYLNNQQLMNLEKRTLSVLLFLFSLAVFAQNDWSSTDVSEAKKENARTRIDTLDLKLGKAYVLLIDISEGSYNVQVAGDDQERNELQKNFGEKAFEIINIYNYSYVKIANGQYLDVSEEGASYQAMAYWSGKEEDNIVVREGKRLATEFISEQIGGNKKSSYLLNSDKHISEVEKLQKKNFFTSKSKEVMNTFLKNYSVSSLCKIKNNIVFNNDQKGVKTITSFITNEKGKSVKWQTIELDENALPKKIIEYDDNGKAEVSNLNFEYKDGQLIAINRKDESVKISFNDTELIERKDLGGAIETVVYKLEKNTLLRKAFLIMKDEGGEHQNSLTEEKIENNCLKYYIDGVVWSVNCNSKINEFPFSHSYTSYQDGAVLQKVDYKIIKKNNLEYEMTVTDELSGTVVGNIVLNERNLLESYNYKEGKSAFKSNLVYTYY